MPFLRVALDVPVATLFDYRCDDAEEADVGLRVEVPFGRGRRIGLVLGVAGTSEVPGERLRSATRVLRDLPRVPEDVLALVRFCADYYHHPVGEVAAAALPAGLRAIDPAAIGGWYALTDAGREAAPVKIARRALLRDRLLDLLRSRGTVDGATVVALSPRAGPALRALLDEGLVAMVPEPGAAALAAVAMSAPPEPTAEQAAAVAAIAAGFGRFEAFLLHGVTGSGKTEVYLRLVANVLAEGRQALELVPEINLTPQLEAMFRARFPEVSMVSLHSGLPDGERHRNWLAAQAGEARVVLGTRLAVFTPMPRLALIVVDEEHDASFRQAEGLRYSARDIAVLRARERAIPVVLGSATPSLESYQRAVAGHYRLVELPQRVSGALPAVHCVDVKTERPVEGLAPRLVTAIGERLARGEQALVFINRRGYSPVLMCHACGWMAGCQRCSARLVYHAQARQLACHHCGHEEAVIAACPQCGNVDLQPVGQGTQRIEAALARAFPQARVLRVDRDTTRRRHAWREMRRSIEDREVDILVGTQILAKGHDFPRLNLVCVLNADSSLYSSDFRAAERLFAQLIQVAGRAGRASEGIVLIQTEFPHHPLYRAVARHDYHGFAKVLLEERRSAGFPPHVYQAILRAEAPRLELALEFLAAAKDAADAPASVTLYDPVPATMMRRAGRERAQLLVQSASRPALQAFLGDWHGACAALATGRVRYALEVDPLDV